MVKVYFAVALAVGYGQLAEFVTSVRSVMATVSPFFAVDLSAETEPLSDFTDVETAFVD